MTEKEKLVDACEKYQRNKIKKENEYSFENEKNYLESAIDFLELCPMDIGNRNNIQPYEEDEINFLRTRLGYLLNEGNINKKFFEKNRDINFRYPISYIKHSLFCDYEFCNKEFNEAERELYKHLYKFGKSSFGGNAGFDRYVVSSYLHYLNDKKRLGLKGKFWEMDMKMVLYQQEKSVGYFRGYVAKL